MLCVCASCVLRLSFRQLFMYVEAEVHYEDIIKIALSGTVTASSHYHFFRQRLAGTVPENELDALLAYRPTGTPKPSPFRSNLKAWRFFATHQATALRE